MEAAVAAVMEEGPPLLAYQATSKCPEKLGASSCESGEGIWWENNGIVGVLRRRPTGPAAGPAASPAAPSVGNASTARRRRPPSGGLGLTGPRPSAMPVGSDISRAGLCPSTGPLVARRSRASYTRTHTGRSLR